MASIETESKITEIPEDLSSSPSPAAPAVEPIDPALDDQPEGYNGDLPDFSDTEQPSESPVAGSSRTSTSKSGAGRKKLPLGLLKKLKLGSPPEPVAKKPKEKAKDKAKDKAKAQGPAKAAVPSMEEALVQANEEGAEVRLSDEMLDRVMAQLSADQGAEFKRIDVQNLLNQVGNSRNAIQGKQKDSKKMSSYKFWKTQPVPNLETALEELREGPLESNKAVEDIRREPIELHSDFRWVTMDLGNETELREVYELLTQNYVEDDDASFRFSYQADFIEWALKPPGYIPDWHIGIRVAKSNKLVGFISGIPIDVRVRAVTKRCTEINFICVHKKLRGKRLAPLLIQEVTRRTHLHGIFQAIYTAGVFLPTPVARCQYYHRNLNPKKLVETGFSPIPRNLTMARMLRLYKVPDVVSLPGLRELERKDLKAVGRLLRAYLARMDMAPLLSNKDVEHAVFAGRGKDVDGKRVGQVAYSYVVEDPETHAITDMFSFYTLPSTAVKAKSPTSINAAYLFYYATTACPSCANLGDGSVATPVTNWKDETEEERKVLKARLNVLVGDALVLASKAGFDVFNALTLQDNALFLEELKFGRGDGFLHYYLYNYATKPILGGIEPTDGGSGVGVVML